MMPSYNIDFLSALIALRRYDLSSGSTFLARIKGTCDLIWICRRLGSA